MSRDLPPTSLPRSRPRVRNRSCSRQRRDHKQRDARRALHGESQAYMRDARIRAATHPPAERGPGAWPGPFAASCRSYRIVVSLNGRFFFHHGVRRICGITIRGPAAQFELLTAVEACAARRLVLVRLNVGVRAHRTVLIDRRRGVLRAERIVDDLLEATGGWSERVAISLGEAGHIISKSTQRVSRRSRKAKWCEQKRTGSMQLSSRVSAGFISQSRGRLLRQKIRILQGLVRRQHSLIQMRVEEENRRSAPMVSPAVTASIEATLEHLARELERVDHEIEQLFDDYPPLRRQRELLVSIPGIAESTAARILGEMPTSRNSETSKQLPHMPAYRLVTTSPARLNVVAGSRRTVTLT